jgi:hypothetical protein
MTTLGRLLPRLTRASRDATGDPYARIVWPASLEPDHWCMCPGLISLHGTPAYEALDDSARRALGFYEAINFFSLNVHSERRLIEGIAARLEREPGSRSSDYLRHFLSEEAKHLAFFRDFCSRYAGACYPDRHVDFPTPWDACEEEIVFFGRILVFEELVDFFNRTIGFAPGIEPLVRRINRAHHAEEGRHIAFGRTLLKELIGTARAAERPIRERAIGEYLARFRTAAWRDLYSPDAYRDAGIDQPLAVRDAALAHPSSAARKRRAFRRVDRFLIGIDLWNEQMLS